MKIAYLMHGIGWGGAAGSLLLLLKSIKKLDAEKDFITSIDRDNPARKEFIRHSDSFKVIQLPQLRNHAAGGQTKIKEYNRIISKSYPKLINYLKELEVDILHINSTVFAYLLKAIKTELNIKIVFHVRETLPSYDNGIVREFIINNITKYSDKILCISDNEAIPFNNIDKVEVLPNPFDFESIKNIIPFYRSQFNYSEDTIIVAMSGQFSELKGHKFFLESINYLNKNFQINNPIIFIVLGVNGFTPMPKVLLKKLFGRKDYSYAYSAYLKKHRLGSLIHTLPMLYTHEFYNLLSEIDIYVRPSLSGDPWGRDIIEAMALGKPIIATGESEFYIKNNKSGFLVKPGDPKEMAEKMHLLISDKELRKKFGEKGKSIIKAMCDLNNYGERISTIYSSLLS